MVKVTFKFKDVFTRGKWVTRSGTYESVDQCIKMNGLGTDCEYEIVSVEELE